jgi:hypothetical protein
MGSPAQHQQFMAFLKDDAADKGAKKKYPGGYHGKGTKVNPKYRYKKALKHHIKGKK